MELNPQQFSLYRGEGSHDRPSYYPTKGPDANLSGAWWTDSPHKAHQYATSAKGSMYKIDVDPTEAKPRGMRGNYVIEDPAVRSRRVSLEGS